MYKTVFFTFNGQLMCFAHALLNALDLYDKNMEVRIVIEGASTALVPELMLEGRPFSELFKRCLDKGIIDGVCKACAAKMGVFEKVEDSGLMFLDDLNGHPAMSRYLDDGFSVITI